MDLCWALSRWRMLDGLRTGQAWGRWERVVCPRAPASSNARLGLTWFLAGCLCHHTLIPSLIPQYYLRSQHEPTVGTIPPRCRSLIPMSKPSATHARATASHSPPPLRSSAQRRSNREAQAHCDTTIPQRHIPLPQAFPPFPRSDGNTTHPPTSAPRYHRRHGGAGPLSLGCSLGWGILPPGLM